MTIFIDDIFLIDLDTWKISFKFRIFIFCFFEIMASKNNTLLISLFVPCFVFFWDRECISYLVQLTTMLYIVEVADEFHINIVITKLKFEANLEACLGVFWNWNWILLAISIINCFNKFVHKCVFLLLFINRFFCLLKICHIDVKCSKLLLHLN